MTKTTARPTELDEALDAMAMFHLDPDQRTSFGECWFPCNQNPPREDPKGVNLHDMAAFVCGTAPENYYRGLMTTVQANRYFRLGNLVRDALFGP